MGCWAFSSYRLNLISASLKGCQGGALGYSNPLKWKPVATICRRGMINLFVVMINKSKICFNNKNFVFAAIILSRRHLYNESLKH